MAVLVIAEVAGQTLEGYEGMRSLLAEGLRAAPRFVLHRAHPIEGAWRVIEIWQSKAEADRFFTAAVAPNLPPGNRPKRSVRELHGLR
jgi:hypothetical protein